jgi:heme O synthase-like polyprenyltransferase
MITSAVTAAIVAVLAFFGISPSAGLVGGIWIVVKVLIVLTLSFLSYRAIKKERDKKAAEAAAARSPDA